MSANVDAMVEAAIRAYRAGNKEEARALLFRVVDIDERHEQAWLWLSAVVESPDDQRTCLENVLAINPNNDRAKQGLEVLVRKANASKPPADDLAGLTFGEPQPPARSQQQTASASAPANDLPDIDWADSGIETSSASANFRGQEPSAKDYDDWVSGLNLGGNSGGIFGEDGGLKDNVFGFDDEDDKPAPKPAASTASAPAFVGPFEAEFDDDFDLSLDDDDFIPPPQKPAPAASKPTGAMMSPPAPEQRTAQKQPPGGKRATADITSELDTDYDDVEFDYQDQDLEELFMVIPNEIRPTRLPGTRERVPAALLIGILLLIVLNIGAVVLLISQLTAQTVS